MDDVLDGTDLETQAVLLGIIQDFLIAESVKSGTNDKKTEAEKERECWSLYLDAEDRN